MRLTIVKDDNKVVIGTHPSRVVHNIDCSELPEGFHALQWYDTWGDVETCIDGQHSNERITDLSPYQKFIDAHVELQAKKEAEDAKVTTNMEVEPPKDKGVNVIS